MDYLSIYFSVTPSIFIFLSVLFFSGLLYSGSLFYTMVTIYFVALFIFIFVRLNLMAKYENFLFSWYATADGTSIDCALVLDLYNLEFSIVLLFLSLSIQIYAGSYFKKDPEFSRFSLLLGFFIFFMLLMINTISLTFMFIAWEGVGLLSFLLVSFWYSKVNTLKSGLKVLFYNRLGDFFFFIVIGAILFFFKSDNFNLSAVIAEILNSGCDSKIGGTNLKVLVGFAIILVILSKSAQFGFHIWLLEAMEAPLPASSLIHSATLVCAGVVLLIKTPTIMYEISQMTIYLIVWSCLTSCALSFSALFNYDIKKVLAYSTGSHVSLMLALSISAGSVAGFTYTLIHASSKVFIFLLFGFIIDANAGIRDIRKMGGFFKVTGLTYFGAIGALILSSLPLFPLAVLKDDLIINLLRGGIFLEVAGSLIMFSAILNYLYMLRLFFKIFFGDSLGVTGTYVRGLALGVNGFYFSKKAKNFLQKSPLIFLIIYILFFEAIFLVYLLYDYSYSEVRVIDFFTNLYPNAYYMYLSFSNSFFFFFALTAVTFKTIR